MRKYILFSFLTLAVLAGFILYAQGGLLKPINIFENTTIIIEKGQSTQKIAAQLKELKIISHKISFFAGVLVLKLQKIPLKHGEYLIEAKQTLWQILQKIAKGDVVVHYLTIPEGLTVYEISKKIEDI